MLWPMGCYPRLAKARVCRVCPHRPGLLLLPCGHAQAHEPGDKRHGCRALPLQSFQQRLSQISHCQPTPRHVREPSQDPQSCQANHPSCISQKCLVLRATKVPRLSVTQHRCGNTSLTRSSFKIATCDILSQPFTFMSLTLSSCKMDIISSPLASSRLGCVDQIREWDNISGSSFQKGKMCSKFRLVWLILLLSGSHVVLPPSPSRDDQKLLLIPCARSGHFHLSYLTGGKLRKYTLLPEANLSSGVFPASESQ